MRAWLWTNLGSHSSFRGAEFSWETLELLLLGSLRPQMFPFPFPFKRQSTELDSLEPQRMGSFNGFWGGFQGSWPNSLITQTSVSGTVESELS